MLATWGLSLALVGIVTWSWDGNRGGRDPLSFVSIGAYNVSIYRLVVIAAAIGLLVLTYVLFNRTRAGRARSGDHAEPNHGRRVWGGASPGVHGHVRLRLGAGRPRRRGDGAADRRGAEPGARFHRQDLHHRDRGRAGHPARHGPPLRCSAAESVVAYLSTPIYGQVAMLGLALVILRLFPDGLSGLWLRRGWLGRDRGVRAGGALIALLRWSSARSVQLTVFLIYGMLALSLDLIWGIAGILSLARQRCSASAATSMASSPSIPVCRSASSPASPRQPEWRRCSAT